MKDILRCILPTKTYKTAVLQVLSDKTITNGLPINDSFFKNGIRPLLLSSRTRNIVNKW